MSVRECVNVKEREREAGKLSGSCGSGGDDDDDQVSDLQMKQKKWVCVCFWSHHLLLVTTVLSGPGRADVLLGWPLR